MIFVKFPQFENILTQGRNTTIDVVAHINKDSPSIISATWVGVAPADLKIIISLIRFLDTIRYAVNSISIRVATKKMRAMEKSKVLFVTMPTTSL